MSAQVLIAPLKTKRLGRIQEDFVRRLSEKRTCVLRQLAVNWAEEMRFWRFLSNDRVSVPSLIARSTAGIGEAVAGRSVLCIQDGSTISLCGRLGGRKGFCAIGGGGEHPGFHLHPSLVLDARTGSCLGLGDVAVHDEPRAVGDKHWNRHQDVLDKKTGTWLRCGMAARERLGAADSVTHIADREADFFEMMLEFGQNRRENEHFIVRSNADRHLGHLPGRGKTPYKGSPDVAIWHRGSEHPPLLVPHRSPLAAMMRQLPVRAVWELPLPATCKRSARTARVELRFAEQVPICRPQNGYARTYQGQPLPGSLKVTVVEVREIDPPSDPSDEPVHWRLFTSHPVKNVEDARQIVQWYAWRWKIELLFAAAKSRGLDLEHAQIQYADRLKKLAILVAMAAVTVIQLIQARDGTTQQPIADAFEPEDIELLCQIAPKLEGKTLKQQNPHPAHSLAFAAWVIARLGGWKGYKTHRPPGIGTMSRGLQRFFQIKNDRLFLSG